MGYIHSIQTFGTVDGPGVRFVVFFQGCPMRCQYCHNPDTWDMGDGKEKSVDEIIEMFERNRVFYKTGGITATGGEPMMQMEFLIELFTRAKELGVHTCLDTSGVAFREEWLDMPENAKDPLFERVQRLMAVTDLVMLDIKHIDEDEHVDLTGCSNYNILAFARYLDKIGMPMWVRHVVVPGITYKEEYLTQFGEFLKTLSNVEKLEVLPYHTLGENKYEKLGMEYPLKGVPQLSKEEARHAEEVILKAWGKWTEADEAASKQNKNNQEDTDEKAGGIVCRSC